MKKVVVDTNILISASFWRGNPYKIMQLAGKGKIEAFTSIAIIEEFANSLQRDFKIKQQEIDERTTIFLEMLKLVNPTTKVQEIKDDPNDDKILEAALEAKANYIVSGDKHLLKLKEFKRIKIVKAKEFLDSLK